MFPQRWLPTASVVLPEPFTEANKLLNSTMKVVRRKVEDHFSNEIGHLYTPAGRTFLSARNKNNIQKYMP